MSYIDQAIQDVEVLKALQENGFTIGSTFRVKQLGQNITHSGSTFQRLCRIGALKVIEKGKEKITITYTDFVFKDPQTNTIYENYYGLTREIRNRLVRQEIQITKEIETTFNIYEMLVNDEDFALESFKNVMQECEHEIFLKMSRVQARIAEIYNGFYKVRGMKWEIEWTKRQREWEKQRQENN